MPVTSGMTATRLKIIQEMSSDTTMAAMNQAVAVKMPARPFIKKKMTSGPSSSANLMICCLVSPAMAGAGRLFVGHCMSFPAIRPAKSLAENGSRSSTASPTPMKCTGKP